MPSGHACGPARSGVMAQERNLFDHLTVTGNVRLAQRLGASGSDRRRPEVTDLLESLGLAGRSGAYPHQLSGGETARAGLAVALANTPAVVVADEPTGELDAETEGAVLDLFRQHTDRGGCALIASHSAAVRTHADRVVQLQDGRYLEGEDR